MVLSVPTPDLALRRLSREDYHRLIDLGVFDEDEKVELLNGLLVVMSPQKTPHAWAVDFLTMHLVPRLAGRARVRAQLPLAVSDDSEPEPDIAVVAEASYRKEHPATAYLVIEAAESSLSKDRNVKGALYAQAGVAEYWIVDVLGQALEVYTEPQGGRYAALKTYRPGQSVALVAFPDVTVPVAELF